jgi:hypothetical protein
MSKKRKVPLPTIELRLKMVMKFAFCYEWEYVGYQKDIEMISYFRDGCRLNVYLTTMTVATALNHPFKGKTQLFRKGVAFNTLEKIMMYPRVHTKKGYYTKKYNHKIYGTGQKDCRDKKRYSGDFIESAKVAENNGRENGSESNGITDADKGTLQEDRGITAELHKTA